MFRLEMSHLQAFRTYCFDRTVIINEMLARYGIPYGCTTVIIVQPEDDSLRVETFCNMKFIIIYTGCPG
jgi:hypothetical protein